MVQKEIGKKGETAQDEQVALAEAHPEASEMIKDDAIPEAAVEKLERVEEQERQGPALELVERIGEGDMSDSVRDKESADNTEDVVGSPTQAQVDGSSSLADRMGAKVGNEEEAEAVEVGDDFEAQIEVQREELPVISPVRDIEREGGAAVEISREGKSLVKGKEDTEPSINRTSGLSPYTDPPTVLSFDESSSTKGLKEFDEEARKLEKPSRSLYIAGLVRPLTLPSFRAKMEEFGQLGGTDVKEDHQLWLDGVKTHAYVTVSKR